MEIHEPYQERVVSTAASACLEVVGQFELLNKSFSADRLSTRCDNGSMSRPNQPKRPADLNQRAHQVFLEALGELPSGDPTPVPAGEPEKPPAREKDPAAVALGRKGGLKGGKARIAGMTQEQVSEAARKAANSRWQKRKTK